MYYCADMDNSKYSHKKRVYKAVGRDIAEIPADYDSVASAALYLPFRATRQKPQ